MLQISYPVYIPSRLCYNVCYVVFSRLLGLILLSPGPVWTDISPRPVRTEDWTDIWSGPMRTGLQSQSPMFTAVLVRSRSWFRPEMVKRPDRTGPCITNRVSPCRRTPGAGPRTPGTTSKELEPLSRAYRIA